MRKGIGKTISVLVVMLAAASVASADIKLKMKSGESTKGNTMYIKGSRQRMESEGATILTQCDLKRMVYLNDKARTYLIMPMDGSAAGQTATAATPQQPQQPVKTRKGGIVTTTSTVTDTGQRKEIMGFTARRIKTVMVTESTPDACNPSKTRMETDGWYIDLEYQFSCGDGQGAAAMASGSRPECADEHRFKQIGTAKLGFPLMVTTTFFGEDGRQSFTSNMEVEELSRATLDAALFEIPAGYTEAKNMQEFAMAGARMANPNEDNSQPASAGSTAGATTPATTSATALGPKKPGVIRIGVVVPKAQMGKSYNGIEAAEPLRNTIISYLSGPTLEVTPLTARIPAQIEAEAQQKECDLILYSSITHKQSGGGGGLGGFMRKAAPAVGIAGSHADTHAGRVAGSVATSATYTAADVASSIKAKDEITFEYQLHALGSATPRLTNTTKAKAKSDGEDILSPLVEQAAIAIVAEATKK